MPATPLHLLRVNARELLRVPGTQRPVGVELDADTLGVDDARITGSVVVDLEAVSNIDGIVVHGTVSVPWATVCRRCLTDVVGTAVIDVDEIYQDEVVDEDAFAIEGDQIDLAIDPTQATSNRQAVLNDSTLLIHGFDAGLEW